MVTSAELSIWVTGLGATEEEASLNAARRLKEKVAALSPEELLKLMDGEIGHDLAPDEIPEDDAFGPLAD